MDQIDTQKAELFAASGAYNLDQGNYTIAIDQCDRALAVDPSMGIAWNNKAKALSLLGQQEAALSCYDKAMEVTPDRFEFPYHKGILLMQLGRYQLAIAPFQLAANLQPTHLENINNLGLCFAHLGNFQQAIEYFDQCLKLAPNQPSYLESKFHCLQQLGKNADADLLLDQMIPRHLENPNILLIRPKLLWANGKEVEAIQFLDTLYNQYQTPNILLAKAYLYHEKNKGTEAIQSYEAYLVHDPEEVNVLFNKAKVEFGIGNFEQALATNDRIIQITEAIPEFYQQRISIFERMKSRSAVKELVDLVSHKFPTYKSNLLYHFGLYLKFVQKDYTASIQQFEALNTPIPAGSCHYQIALNYNLLEDYKNCLIHLEKAFELDPNTKADAQTFHELNSLRQNPDFNRLISNNH